jgi:hypothetical protein
MGNGHWLIAGPDALTGFEAERLLGRVRALDAGVRSLQTVFFYALELRNDGQGALDGERLKQLLEP